MLDLEALLEAEQAENECRKEFTPSERVAIADAIKAELGNRAGRPKAGKIQENFPALSKGKQSRDIAAEKAGFGNAKTYERAKKVVEEGAHELVAAMDAGAVAISTAAVVAGLPADEQAAALAAGPVGITRPG